MTEPNSRPARWLTPSGSVVIPPTIASWLEKRAGITAETRGRLETTDPEARAVLVALHMSAMLAGSPASGTTDATAHPGQPQSDPWMTTTEVARALAMTESGIRKAIARQRIPAEKRGRQYFIRHTDVLAYKMTA